MRCPRCGAGSREGLRFCEDCGGRLALACPQCGADATPGKKFCGACGALLGADTAPRLVTPESYTPKHLAEKILVSRSALEGERKQVTVLFADLNGSMELLADHDPEEVAAAEPIAEALGDHRRLGMLSVYRARMWWLAQAG